LTLVHDLLIRDRRWDLAASETTQTCAAECWLDRKLRSVCFAPLDLQKDGRRLGTSARTVA
jgi:hypothetical protein